MINVKDIKSLLRHSIYVMHFKLVRLTSTDHNFLRKGTLKDHRQVPSTRSGAKPLEAECVSIEQFTFEMKIQCILLFSLYPL